MLKSLPRENLDEAVEAATAAGLIYVTDDEPGIKRRQRGKSFQYVFADDRIVKDRNVLSRIRSLVIPPAWTDVWICRHPNGHLQATGRDARGRKQFLYHPAWREMRDQNKFDRILEFADMLPSIRATVAKHMAGSGLSRQKVIATVVSLLEKTLIRVGNSEYVRENKSYGLTTLRNRHLDVRGTELRFRFVGKSGKVWQLGIKNRRIAKVVRSCQELPGQQLFQYLDDAGEVRGVTSTDVNSYLREITGADVTAKDFRTWAGTVLVTMALRQLEAFESAAQAKRNLRAAIAEVASRLGNTPTICRKCYVHPTIIDRYLDGTLLDIISSSTSHENDRDLAGLTAEETDVLAMLKGR
jgi:DNA topoisomerase I